MAGPYPFARLVRFENELGEVKYGEVAADSLNTLVGSTVKVYKGDLPWGPDFQESGENAIVRKVSDAQPSVLYIPAADASRS